MTIVRNRAKEQARSSCVRQGVSKRPAMDVLFASKEAGLLDLLKIRDSVVAVSIAIQNGVIISIDFLEPSPT